MGVKKRVLIILLIMFFVSLAAVSAGEDNETDVISVDIQDNNASVSTVEVDSVEKNIDSDVQSQEESDENNADQSKNNVKLAGANDNGVVLGASADNDVLGATYNFYSLYSSVNGLSGYKVLTDNYFLNDYTAPKITLNNGAEIVGDAGNGQKITIDANSRSRVFLIASDATVKLKNIIFKNGREVDGGIFLMGARSTLILEDCIFQDCKAPNNGRGGVIFGHGGTTVSCTGCQFFDCEARGGGVIFLYGNSSYRTSLSLDNCYFHGNKANVQFSSSQGTGGGAIHLEQSKYVKINNCKFDDNYALYNGGVILFNNGYGTANITNSNFTNNEANAGGAIRFSNTQLKFYVDNCIFENNTATTGPTISTPSVRTGLEQYVSNSKFINNHASSGVGTSLTANKISVYNTEFRDNTASSDGAGLFIGTDSKNVLIDSCNFTNNKANANGGGISFYKSCSNAVINNCNFDENTAQNGGALYWSGSELTVKNSNFENVNASLYGGAIYLKGSNTAVNFNLSYNNFTNCHSKYYGGAIYGEYAYGVIISNSNFTSNVAEQSYGGALYWLNPNELTISDVSFEKNIATAGGAIDINDGSNVVLINCDFENNNATSERGGAVVLWTTKKTEIKDSNFTNNHAISNGENSLGGAVFSSGQDGIYSNNRFENNTAHNSGGALYISTNTANITKSTFINNSATVNGGALYYLGNSGYLEYSDFLNNRAGGYGGAVVFHTDVEGHILGSTFKNNVANGDGGALIIVDVVMFFHQHLNRTPLKVKVEQYLS